MPNPSIMRRERGNVRSDMIHITICMDSGVSEMKSQNVSCAVADCGKPRSGSIFTAWIKSGNLNSPPGFVADPIIVELNMKSIFDIGDSALRPNRKIVGSHTDDS
jgi:hypothetical protein